MGIDYEKLFEFETLEDGFVYLWIPMNEYFRGGALSAGNLRGIADYLDAKNKAHSDGIEEYFKKHP